MESNVNASIRTETITVPIRRRHPLNPTYVLQRYAPYVVILLISVIAYSFFRTPARDVNQIMPVLNDIMTPAQEGAQIHLHETIHTSEDMQRDALADILISKEKAKEKMGAFKDTVVNMEEKGAEDLKARIVDLKETGVEKIKQGSQKLAEKWEDVKQAGNLNERLSDLKEKGKEKLTEMTTGVRDTVEAVGEGMKEAIFDDPEVGIKAKAKNILRNLKDKTQEVIDLNAKKLTPLSTRIGSFLQKVKDGVVQDEQLRLYFGRKHRWDKLTLTEKADIIIKEMHLMGDDVVEEMIDRMEHEKMHHPNKNIK